MEFLLYAVLLLSGLGSLVCFVLVLIQMFQRGQTGLGIVCAVLSLCGGLGPLIAFVYGWMKSTEWNLKNVMLAWTGCVVVVFLSYIPLYFIMVAAVQQQMQQIQQMHH